MPDRQSITVLTSITGGKDNLVDDQKKGDARWLAFTDGESKTWEIKSPPSVFKDARRNSRMPKLLSHQYSDTEYSIWMDGNMRLLKPPELLVKRYLKDHDMALFKHTLRDCIYGEATRCAVAKLDDPEVIIEQVVKYEKQGYPKNKGLCECGFIIRRHTPRVKEFNNLWFSEYARHSVRDQISFMYALDSVGIKVNFINEPWRMANDGYSVLRSDFLQMYPHVILNPPV